VNVFSFRKHRLFAKALCATLWAGFVVAGVGHAQMRMKAEIPFDFMVGKTSLPAGTYSVKVALDGLQLELYSAGGARTVTMLGAAEYRPDFDSQKGRLLFNDYGDIHILKAVWIKGQAKGGAVPVPKATLELAKRHLTGTTEVATR
jgi:hypothetical protein